MVLQGSLISSLREASEKVHEMVRKCVRFMNNIHSDNLNIENDKEASKREQMREKKEFIKRRSRIRRKSSLKQTA